MTSGTFVLTAVGNFHLRRAEFAAACLRRVTQSPVVILCARAAPRSTSARVISVDFPDALSNHQASILLKTGCFQHLDLTQSPHCYIDTDVIAVSSAVEHIFAQPHAGIAFASDHKPIDKFSPWAVHCGCELKQSCPHLRERISADFNVQIPDPNWPLWNGGVFVFDHRARPFLTFWHSLCARLFALPAWRVRDQGALAATAWACNMQTAPTLDRRFNQIVDCLSGTPMRDRETARPEALRVDNSYSLTDYSAPAFLHFINHGIARRGWKNWDDIEALLGPDLKKILPGPGTGTT